MRYYEIALPTVTNDGASYKQAWQRWEQDALDLAGGFTRRPDGDGAWRDPLTGKLYYDRMRCYRVAVETKDQFKALVNCALDLFPDQVAIFTAEIGEATIYERDGERGLAPAETPPVMLRFQDAAQPVTTEELLEFLKR